MRLRTSSQTQRDLTDIHLTGTILYGEPAADAYLDALVAEFRRIIEWPLASRERTEVQPPIRLRRCVAHNIFYDVVDDEVTIVRVLHHSIDWMSEL